jgi:hypothetical protein
MTPIAPNEKPAAATIRDRLELVLTTTPLTSRKDRSNELVHAHGARIKRQATRPVSDFLAS